MADNRTERVRCLRSNGEIPLECGALNRMDKRNASTQPSRGICMHMGNAASSQVLFYVLAVSSF